MENIHEGHRSRQFEKFNNVGLDAFTDVEVLEMLLYFSIPRGDTNPLAHRLLDTFGSLSNVLNADRAALLQVNGVGERTATLIHLQLQLMRRYYINQTKPKESLFNYGRAERVVRAYLLGKQEEFLYMFCLSSKRELINVLELQRGSIDTVSVYSRDVIGKAINSGAAAVILAHNHPSGNAIPSHEDVVRTQELEKLFTAMGIDLSDHFVISTGEFVSFKRAGLIGETQWQTTGVAEELIPYQANEGTEEIETGVRDRSLEAKRYVLKNF